MKLKGIDFGNVFVASGTLNFFGQAWPYHRLYKKLFKRGFNFSGATFIAKTTTLLPRAGNMPLKPDYQPRELFPDCIRVNFLKGIVLNSVGLSGPGVYELISKNVWQNLSSPFLISFMSLGETLEEKIRETNQFVELIADELPKFKTSVGIQVNVSCPNTEHPTNEMIRDSLSILEVFSPLNVPIDLKIGAADAYEVGTDFIKEIEASGLCDCLTCSNTIPWGKMSDWINWRRLYGTLKSPLSHLGGGGFSGKPLLPIVINWLKQMRDAGINMSIKAGGGILSQDDALQMFTSEADAIEIGSVAILRPWRVRGIIGIAQKHRRKA